ncbi:MAG TPA: DUF5808 domain-containing protein [Thermomicrobiales bacterium]|nr:DUF5808 domain-containing protein [Thermomicrobiales bacterium]
MRKFARRVGWLVGLALVALAIYDQLARDPRHRDWHGNVFGVPYDFRIPTLESVKEKVWAPDNPRIFTPHVFGVGWAINAGRIVHLLKQQAGMA